MKIAGLGFERRAWEANWVKGVFFIVVVAVFNLNVPICCPACPVPTCLSAISGVFDVRRPAELVKLLRDTPSWRCKQPRVSWQELAGSWFPFASHPHVTPKRTHGDHACMFNTRLTRQGTKGGALPPGRERPLIVAASNCHRRGAQHNLFCWLGVLSTVKDHK